MQDTSHLVALIDGLSPEKARLASAKNPKEIAIRKVWVSQYERQIADEYKFLGMSPVVECDLSDDELLAALSE